jgi:multiple antibiotic resistance protein
MTVFSAAMLLFLVIDPIGNIPLFLCILKKTDQRRQKKIILRELFIALLVLVLFLFIGRYILTFLGISEPSLSIAGGIILFLIAIKMIFADLEEIFGGNDNGEPMIVPLAIPLIAGPSAMTVVLLLMAREPSRWLEWLIALLCAWSVSVVILLLSNGISQLFGKRGLTALERLMGMLLTTVAVEMFLRGLNQMLLR